MGGLWAIFPCCHPGSPSLCTRIPLPGLVVCWRSRKERKTWWYLLLRSIGPWRRETWNQVSYKALSLQNIWINNCCESLGHQETKGPSNFEKNSGCQTCAVYAGGGQGAIATWIRLGRLFPPSVWSRRRWVASSRGWKANKPESYFHGKKKKKRPLIFFVKPPVLISCCSWNKLSQN